MTNQNLFILKSNFSFGDKGFLSEFLYRAMFRCGSSLWVSLCAFMLNIVWLAAKSIERLTAGRKPQANGANFEDDQVVSPISRDFAPDLSEEKGSSEFSFSFPCQESKASRGNFAETDDLSFLQSGFSASTRKYQFVSGKNVSGFVQKPETMSFIVQEMFVGSTDVFFDKGQNLDLVVLMKESNSEVVEFDSKVPSIGSIEEFNLEEKSIRMDELSEAKQEANSADHQITNNEEINHLEDYPLEDDDISYEVQLLPSNEFAAPDLKLKSENSGDGLHANNLEVQSDEFPVQILASGTLMSTNERNPEIIERSPSFNLLINREANVTEDTAEDVDGEYIELDPDSKNTIDVDEENSSQKIDTFHEDESTLGKGMSLGDDDSQKFGEASLEKELWESDSDDEDELDILYEHHQLVQQMKMEMKNSKIRALPTISEEEECETPKMAEDFKPLKIPEKFEYKDLMEEIHKFYKSYADKMRKLDVLNYQTLNAINIVQFKDSQVFVSTKKATFLPIKHFSLPSFWVGKQRRIFADPSLKSITEMQRVLELVYIGQVCLSWEILRWQYGKLKLLLEYDSQCYHSYNLVAGEYQQLQVLMQRFLEDEPFQGPRIQHYVKSRCFCRSLLQVPMIKDDCFKDKKDRFVGEKDAIPITKLAETIKESMQVFWEFICADKYETNGALKGVQGSAVDPQNTADPELFMNIKTCLEKKERKLKVIQRSTNCIVKKFQKHQAAGRSSTALLIAQVELKLVSRVLNLSRLASDQLLWCQKKLNNIHVVNRENHEEHAFLLFPC